jgi:hypothetical protein
MKSHLSLTSYGTMAQQTAASDVVDAQSICIAMHAHLLALV